MTEARSRLLLATTNPGKVAEIAELLSETDWQVVPLPEGVPEYEETGATFADNARGKALFYSQWTGLPALADDSGIEIDALGGEPGVYSARYVDPDIPQSRRNEVVIERLAGLPPEERGARFVCHLVLAVGDRVVHETSGTCEGIIADALRGEGGFGYDPIFLVPELGRTFAELSRDQKSALSHRGRAVRPMVEFLRRWRPADDEDVS
jgi:XTP/dITP diphosphohydrolase